jgi:hypothetical protein
VLGPKSYRTEPPVYTFNTHLAPLVTPDCSNLFPQFKSWPGLMLTTLQDAFPRCLSFPSLSVRAIWKKFLFPRVDCEI